MGGLVIEGEKVEMERECRNAASTRQILFKKAEAFL